MEGDDAPDGSDDLPSNNPSRNRRRRTTYGKPTAKIDVAPAPMAQAYLSPQSEGRAPLRDHTGLQDHGTQQQLDPYFVNNTANTDEAGQDQEVTNETAAALFQAQINTPGDAIHLLLEASGRSEDIQLQSQSGQGLCQGVTRGRESASSSDSPHAAKPEPVEPPVNQTRLISLDPAIAGIGMNHVSQESLSEVDAQRVWSRMRFVRAGWFTAKEAIAYVK